MSLFSATVPLDALYTCDPSTYHDDSIDFKTPRFSPCIGSESAKASLSGLSAAVPRLAIPCMHACVREARARVRFIDSVSRAWERESYRIVQSLSMDDNRNRALPSNRGVSVCANGWVSFIYRVLKAGTQNAPEVEREARGDVFASLCAWGYICALRVTCWCTHLGMGLTEGASANLWLCELQNRARSQSRQAKRTRGEG